MTRSDSWGPTGEDASTGQNAEGAKQAAATAEACSAQTATADRCASSKETADPRFHRSGTAERHRGAIRAVSACAKVAAKSLPPSTATRTLLTLGLGTGSRAYCASDARRYRPSYDATEQHLLVRTFGVPSKGNGCVGRGRSRQQHHHINIADRNRMHG